jgi:prepilin-type N-terminal cleavage/methylation domain-containing protein
MAASALRVSTLDTRPWSRARRGRPWSRARRGFTIIELTVVLIMVGIIAGMAMPRLNYQRYRADAAARVTRAVLQTSQRAAIMRQTNMLIVFDIAQRRMHIIEDSNNSYSYDAGERVRVRPLEEGATFRIPTAPVYGSTVPSTPVAGPNMSTVWGLPAIAFLRDGASSTDLNIYICSARCPPENQRALVLTQASGRTESWRHNGSTWRRTSL